MIDLGALVTLADAAHELGLSPITLRAQAREGRFRAARVGRDYVTTRDEIDRYRECHRGRRGGHDPARSLTS